MIDENKINDRIKVLDGDIAKVANRLTVTRTKESRMRLQ